MKNFFLDFSLVEYLFFAYILKNVKFLFYVCACTMIPGLLVRIPFGGGGILLADVFLPIFTVFWCLNQILVVRTFPRNSFVASGFIFLGIAFLSWIFGAWSLNFSSKILSFSYLVRFFSILVFGWAASEIFKNSSKIGETSFEKITNIFFFIVFLVLCTGYVQFFFYPDLSKISTVGGFDPHIGRLLGTWMDPNFVAGLLGFFLPIGIARWYESKIVRTKFLLGFFVLSSVYALFLTFSRSGYLAAAFGLFFFFLFRDPKIIVFGVFAVLVGLASSERATERVRELSGTMAAVVLRDTDEVDPTAKLRVKSWQKSIEFWEKHPWIGIGYNTYRARAAEEGIVDENFFSAGGSDSTLLTILVTTGVFGGIAFLFFCAQIWTLNFLRYLRSCKNHKKTESERYLGFTAGFAALLVHSLFVNSLLFPLIFMPVMAIASALEKDNEQ